MRFFFAGLVGIGAGIMGLVTVLVTVFALFDSRLASLPQTADLYPIVIAAALFPGLLLATIVFSLLSSEPLYHARTNETNCRRCAHILRSLTKPRCPECGEPI